MITFWLVCAIFVAIALAFILPPLLQRSSKDQNADDRGRKEANIAVYRDQLAELEADLANGIVSREQYAQDLDEMERRLLDDVASPGDTHGKPSKVASESRGAVYALALGIPILATALYLRIGNPNNSPTREELSQPAVQAANGDGDFSRQRIEANVGELAKRLEQNPGDLQGWTMLARSYTMLNRYSDASKAYEKATALKSDDADLWADYAFALGMANGQKLQGQPTELINKALKLDRENAKALELAGSAAFEAKDYKLAMDYWQRLMKKVPAGSEVAESLSERIKEAERLSETPATK